MLSLVSLNVEFGKHLPLSTAFLRAQKADVICLQELLEKDVPAFEEAVGGKCFFVPQDNFPLDGSVYVRGMGICSPLPFLDTRAEQYAGVAGELPVTFDRTTPESKFDSQRYSLVHAAVEKEGKRYQIATTHFVWTPDGEASDLQRTSMASLLGLIRPEEELVLCGDFNAPRGGEIFAKLAAYFTDNIPAKYTTSIDGALHRAGPLERMVDGLFTTPAYSASQVELQSGASDHCAITALIERR